jgi:hypothetical protein
LEDELGFPNDRLLTEELEHEPGSESLFRILSTDLKGDVALNRLTDILTEVDARLAGLRNRHEKIPTDKRDWLRQIIGTVSAAAGSYKQKRLPLKTEGEKSK